MQRSAVIPLLLDALSAYRLTRLITADTILDGPRDALVLRAYRHQKNPKGQVPGVLAEEEGINLLEPGGWSALAQVDPFAPKLATLATCRWCASVHIGMLVVCMRRWLPRQWEPTAKALSLSTVAVLLARMED